MNNIDRIELAKKYYIHPKGAVRPIYIGGRTKTAIIIKDMVPNKIVATMGQREVTCIIIVDYNEEETKQFIEKAHDYLDKMKRLSRAN